MDGLRLLFDLCTKAEFSCKDGKYQAFLIPDRNWGALKNGGRLLKIMDLNKNNLPDIVIKDDGALFVYEWNG